MVIYLINPFKIVLAKFKSQKCMKIHANYLQIIRDVRLDISYLVIIPYPAKHRALFARFITEALV